MRENDWQFGVEISASCPLNILLTSTLMIMAVASITKNDRNIGTTVLDLIIFYD